nr:metallophosphoesterase [Acinetobacter seifertii]
MQKLAEHNFDFDKDLLISVGDLIDKGPENIDCLTLINQPWFTMVRGNHEEMCIIGQFDLRIRDIHLRNGGEWFYSMKSSRLFSEI